MRIKPCDKQAVKFHHKNKFKNMKKIIVATLVLCSFILDTQAQTAAPAYKIITVVESIVPGGTGRSRIVEEKSAINAADFTTERTNGKRSKQRGIKRSNAKVDRFAETKLLNFYSMVGINFQNIASNDALISSKLNQLAQDGWELKFVTSGVEGDAGEKDGKGIFITRFIFARK